MWDTHFGMVFAWFRDSQRRDNSTREYTLYMRVQLVPRNFTDEFVLSGMSAPRTRARSRGVHRHG